MNHQNSGASLSLTCGHGYLKDQKKVHSYPPQQSYTIIHKPNINRVRLTFVGLDVMKLKFSLFIHWVIKVQ